MNKSYPWKVGDLAMYFESTLVSRAPENSKKAIIIAMTESWLDHVEILVEGKVITVLQSTLQVPEVKKVKTSFGFKK